MKQLTEAQAIALGESGIWKEWGDIKKAAIQLHQDCLFLPFAEFQRCVEVALGRSVWTHEFANRAALVSELDGNTDAPTIEEIMQMLVISLRGSDEKLVAKFALFDLTYHGCEREDLRFLDFHNYFDTEEEALESIDGALYPSSSYVIIPCKVVEEDEDAEEEEEDNE